jgi:hypothetical protein
MNIEVIQDFTYNAQNFVLEDTETISIQMNQSMILLPEVPMTPRIADSRVGFSISQYDYGSNELNQIVKLYPKMEIRTKDSAAY